MCKSGKCMAVTHQGAHPIGEWDEHPVRSGRREGFVAEFCFLDPAPLLYSFRHVLQIYPITLLQKIMKKREINGFFAVRSSWTWIQGALALRCILISSPCFFPLNLVWDSICGIYNAMFDVRTQLGIHKLFSQTQFLVTLVYRPSSSLNVWFWTEMSCDIHITIGTRLCCSLGRSLMDF